MDLSHGGHLTHGHKVSMTGKAWQQISFGVDQKTEVIDYVDLKNKAIAEKPNIIVAGFTAYPRVVDFKKFREIADAVGATLFADIAHIAGLVAAGEHMSPFPYADVATTTTHKTLRGPRGGMILTNNEEISKKINSAIFPPVQLSATDKLILFFVNSFVYLSNIDLTIALLPPIMSLIHTRLLLLLLLFHCYYNWLVGLLICLYVCSGESASSTSHTESAEEIR